MAKQVEEEEQEEEEMCKMSSSSSSWIASTNWIVSDNNNASLNSSISFETPISSIKDDVEEEEEFKDSETRKHQPVILIPPPCSSSGESSPCEIKLSFEQRHEIRQVYVRSTARVFEIYYATGPQSDNEYLCTVRCGIAAKEDAPLSASATEEVTSVHSEGSTEPKEPLEEKTRSESTSSTDEDGWVEIKVLDSAFLQSKTSSVAKCIDRNTERNIQNFYEATAEINDSSPCISITLRLLSLHTKGCINLEEIYVFGEPVDPTDCDDKVDPMKPSSENSMMAMLVPTLLQLSKTGMLKRTQDKQVAEVREGLNRQDDESPGSNISGTMQKEAQSSLPNLEKIDLQDAVKGSSDSAQTQSNEPDHGTRKGTESFNYPNDLSSGRVERVLDQLVSRIDRIEAFCSRFEENMLKPISNIETRLERLEQKLEGLTMRSQSSYMHPCTRITAPDFSCVESEPHSLQNDANENNGYRMSDFASNGTKLTRPSACKSDEMESKFPLKDKSGTHPVESGSFIGDDASSPEVAPQLFPGLIVTAPEFSIHGLESGSFISDDASESEVVPQLYPGLIVTAPEFSSEDDMDCNDDLVASKKDFPVNKSSLSIDDALAMALAGFMSSVAPDSPGEIRDKDLPRRSTSSYSSTDAVIRNCVMQEEGIVGSCDEKSFNKIKVKEVPWVSSSSNSSTDAVIRNRLIQEERKAGSFDENNFTKPISGNSNEVEGEINHSSIEKITHGFANLKTPQVNQGHVMSFLSDDSSEAVHSDKIEGKVHQCKLEDTINDFTFPKVNGEEELRLPCDDSTEALFTGYLLEEEGEYGVCTHVSGNQIITENSHEMQGEADHYKSEDTNNRFASLKSDSNLNVFDDDVHKSFIVNPGYNTDELRTTLDFELPVQDVQFTRNEHLNTRYSLETLFNETSEIKLDDHHTGCVATAGPSHLNGTEADLLVQIDNGAEVDMLVQIDNGDGKTGIHNIDCEAYY